MGKLPSGGAGGAGEHHTREKGFGENRIRWSPTKGGAGKSVCPAKGIHGFPTTKQRLDRIIDTDSFDCANEENKSPHWTGAFDINKEEERMVSGVSSCENERQRSSQRQGDQIC